MRLGARAVFLLITAADLDRRSCTSFAPGCSDAATGLYPRRARLQRTPQWLALRTTFLLLL